jgi:periplasmic divalent cation tolerance protein
MLARALVEERLAACVSLFSGARSVYRWKGEICDEEESVMLIKTTAKRVAALCARLKSLHPYDVPEIISIEIRPDEGNLDYHAWLKSCVS